MGENIYKVEPTNGDSKTRICKKFSGCKIYDVTREQKDWITDIKLIIGDL